MWILRRLVGSDILFTNYGYFYISVFILIGFLKMFQDGAAATVMEVDTLTVVKTLINSWCPLHYKKHLKGKTVL